MTNDIKYNRALSFTLAKEGIYSDGPDGETFCGINRRYYPEWVGWTWVDNAKQFDGNVSALALEDFMRDSVSTFYRNHFWNPLQCDKIPFSIAICLFDGAVNSGHEDSVKWLQKAANDLGEYLKVDGVIGKYTLSAIARCNHVTITIKMLGYRLQHYIKLRYQYPEYFGGWVARVSELMIYK